MLEVNVNTHQWKRTFVLLCSVAQLCPALSDPVDCSPPGSSVHGVLQARILERLLFPSPGDLSNPGMEPKTPNGIKSTLLNPMKI